MTSAKEILEARERERIRRIADHTLIASALCSGAISFDPVTSEIRANGLRYPVGLDEGGVPLLSDFHRSEIVRAVRAHARKNK